MNSPETCAPDADTLTVGGIVLCGGRSSRMGWPKLSLPFGDELLLQRVVSILGEVVSPVVVVATPDQEVPPLPDDVGVFRDDQEGRGPLAGLAVGLEALDGKVDAAYVSACDVPLLQPQFVRAIIERLGSHELAIPREDRFHHPLAAVYRTSLAGRVRDLLAADRLRPFFLLEESDAALIDVDQLRSLDPELQSLRNLNTPEEYAAALRDCGE